MVQCIGLRMESEKDTDLCCRSTDKNSDGSFGFQVFSVLFDCCVVVVLVFSTYEGAVLVLARVEVGVERAEVLK